MDTHVEAVIDEKRKAQNKVVKTLLPSIQVHARPKESIKETHQPRDIPAGLENA